MASLMLMLFKKRKTTCLLALSALLFLVLTGSGILTQLALKDLQVYSATLPQWQERNLIIVLGSGTVQKPGSKQLSSQVMGASRLMAAAQLYLNCKKSSENCTVLTTGGDPQQRGMPEASVMEQELQSLGVPIADIVKEDKSHNTFQNAKFTNKVLESRAEEKVILVTSGIHLKRALLYFSHFKIQARGYPSDHLQAQLSFFPSAQNISFLEMALHEYLGTLRYDYYNFMGWNG